MKESDIQKELWVKFMSHKYRMLNLYFFNWESDWLSFLDSGYCWEIEIKVSRSDFLADFKKEKYRRFENCRANKLLATKKIVGGKLVSHLKYVHSDNCPNKFWYAVPKGLISVDEIPEYAGLIYISDEIEIVKSAKFLHKKKHEPQIKFDKFYQVYQDKMQDIFYPIDDNLEL